MADTTVLPMWCRITVIDGFFKEGEVDKAYFLFHEMIGQGLPPDVVTYNSLIDGMCKAQAMDKAEAILQHMFDKGVMPDTRTYNIMIRGYCSLGQLEEAVRLLKKMSGSGLQPDVVTYSFMINIYITCCSFIRLAFLMARVIKTKMWMTYLFVILIV